jgi:hydroxymethylbilane synthase
VLKIGTSSPRRKENIPQFLERALPRLERAPRVELVEIRGNVNTRLGRVHEPDGSERQLDGVVLAFAGLIRLWADSEGRPELEKLLKGVRWMVLPVRENPSAPAQGALAVECRGDDRRVRDLLARLHDERTATDVASERQLLADWGGGCHQKFGATAIRMPALDRLLFIRGRKPTGDFVEELRWTAPPRPSRGARPWDGTAHRSFRIEPTGTQVSAAVAFFVAHSRAVQSGWEETLREARVWTSGVSSWHKLAARGIWVEGCAESLGYEHLAPMLETGVLRLPEPGAWTHLTHEGAADGWAHGRTLATYQLVSEPLPKAEKALLEQATHVFWSSSSQFDELRRFVAPGAVHACGPGKTFGHLRDQGIKPTAFPSAEEWKKWVSKDN